MKIDNEKLKKMVRAIVSTHDREIGCEECFSKVDQFVELKLEGKNPAEALPLVKDHLDRCNNCHEEYKALLAAVKSMSVK